jgi:predicted kinase
MHSDEHQTPAKLEALKREIQVAKDQLSRGQTVSSDEVLARREARQRARKLKNQEQHETLVAVEQGLADMREGRHQPVAAAFDAMRAKHGLSKR